MKPHVFERGDKVYLVSPITPVALPESEQEHFAFNSEIKNMAPNENLYWLKGKYVEADRPNANGHVWEEGEIAIKHLSPMLMPVTVMHDPRTAVGLIADTALRTPDKDNVPRSLIETAMGLWQHRFPEVCEECDVNYKAGSLMQSMECRSPYYTCVACNETFPKLLDGAERKNWCAHMRDSDGHAARILGDVTFTGTGLIFGTRGARGAYDEAHLEDFQAEVQEFHAKAHEPNRPKRRRTSMENMEISREEYTALSKRPTVEEFAAEKKRADDAEAKVAEVEPKLEKAETDLASEKEARETAEQKVKDAEEETAKDELAKGRLAKLGKGFVAKLGEFTKERVEGQARDLSEDDWEARLKELEETTEVKRDEGGAADSTAASTTGSEFSREEVASARTTTGNGGGGGGGTEPSEPKRRSVVAGLVHPKKSS